ncbi:MAG: hypothetical protein M1608_06670 [Candidatus Omnitrophica bacterium]|nr:hypothetical protein [Candidatus Omnitrophota bacterium]
MEPKPSRMHLQGQSAESSRQETELQHQQSHSSAIEFGTVEEMLRYDAAQVSPPATLAARLRDALANEPRRRPAWWRRWLPRRRKE